jgi:hypothetical protein
MQWERCPLCAWSVPLGAWLCEVCQALLANPDQTSVAEARVIVGQLGRALGDVALRGRYQAARTTRKAAASAGWWQDFLRRNGLETAQRAPEAPSPSRVRGRPRARA